MIGPNPKKIGSLAALALLLIFWVGTASAAADVKVEAGVSTNRAAVGEEFRYWVRVSSSRLNFSPDPILPNFGETFEQAGRYNDTQVSFVNGSITSTSTLRITLIANRPGTYTFEPARVSDDGQNYSSEKVTIQIISGTSSSRQPRMVQPRQEPGKPAGGKGEPVMLFTTLSTDTVYVGQQMIYSLEICQRVNVAPGYDIELPTFKGLLKEQLPTTSSSYRKSIDSLTYTCSEVARYALFPTAPGQVRVDQANFTYRIGRSFGFFFDRAGDSQTAHSVPFDLNVKPLPDQGRPADFRDVVGQYAISAIKDTSGAASGEPITFTIAISGRGNVSALPPPVAEGAENFRIYDPKITEDVTPTRAGLSGKKTFEYLVIPEKGGTTTLPLFRLPIFDPQAQRYRVLTAGGGKVEVGEVDAAQASSAAGVVHYDATLRPIALDADFDRKAEPIYKSTAFYLALAAPLFISATIFGLRRASVRTADQQLAARATKAARVALKGVRGASRGNDPAEAKLAELEKIFRRYLEERFNFLTGGFTADDLAAALVGKGLDGPTATQTAELLGRAAELRYTSSAADSEKVSRLAEQISGLIRRVEAQL